MGAWNAWRRAWGGPGLVAWLQGDSRQQGSLSSSRPLKESPVLSPEESSPEGPG